MLRTVSLVTPAIGRVASVLSATQGPSAPPIVRYPLPLGTTAYCTTAPPLSSCATLLLNSSMSRGFFM